ncbi:MAG: ABC transporter ATP-binding protein [Planctomycetota bacterium]|nr:ABC transporter ATP-binding protein [Planctomycetota bacterium]
MSDVVNAEAADGLAIELRGLRKVYPQGKTETVAVDSLDLEVRRGEIFGLLGPNGAGKTTTVEICEGLTPETSGDVCVLGRRWRRGQDAELRARIGVCLQETRFFDKQSVRETLTLFRACYDTGRSVDEALELVSLTDKANARQKSLSGGQRQRLAVATALLGDPELLFLDEPTTGLDPQSRRQLWDVIRGFSGRGGTALLTTHYMEEAEQLCDRVGIVDQGRLIALGTPQELIRALGAEQVIEATVRGAQANLDTAALQQLPGVQACDIDSDQVVLKVESVHEVLPQLLARLKQAGADLDGLATRHATLEDVFVNLTGRHLREGA